MVAFLATTAFVACGDDDDSSNNDQPVIAGLKLSVNTVTFTKDGGTQTVSIQSAVKPTVTSSAVWLPIEVGEMSQTMKVTPVTLVAPAYNGTDDRTATVTVTAGDETKTIAVTQTAEDGLLVEVRTYDVPQAGGTVTVQLTANGDVTATPSADWIEEVTTRGDMQQQTRLFNVAPNNGAARTATITFSKNSLLKETVTINQEGKAIQPLTMTARELAKLMYPGWNLGNTMEPPVAGVNAETSWQSTRTTQQLIDYVKSLGFMSVRIPTSWNCHADGAGTIDAQWTARVKEVVDYCIQAGLYVVLNDHWDNGWIETDGFTDLSEANVTAKADRLKTLWTQIATEFRDYDEHLLFAGLNEPNCDSQAKTDVLLRYEQAFIDAVRATGSNNAQRTLIVQGPSTDIEKTDSYYDVTRLTDTAADRLMVEVHYYTPWNFCGMEKNESWGRMFYYWGTGNHLSGSSYNANWGEESELKKLFQRMKTKFVDRGYPVYIGEYNCQWRDLSGQSGEDQARHDASVRLFHKTVCQQAADMGMVPVVWDINYTNQGGTKGVMTIVNRSALSIFCQPAMDGITEGTAAAVWPY